MKIVIPMAGTGQRFTDKGYITPKPLIKVDDKPFIEHVVKLFPNEENFIFICNSIHIQETNLEEVLNRIAPKCQIVKISPHKKGPVYSVCQVEDMIDDDEEIIVNYCDFGTYWNYSDFLSRTRKQNSDGAIPAYKGFHPHMLGKINYAFMREKDRMLIEIREKLPFTNNRMNEFASNGTYYFKKGKYIKKYFNQLMKENINFNGEYYVSMVYNLLVQDNLSVSVYEIQHMLQWGTPEELEEYKYWSDYFKTLVSKKKNTKVYNAIKLIPAAGEGIRYKNAGFKLPKPLIEISGKPMLIQAANSMPDCSENIFVCKDEHLIQYPLEQELKIAYPNAKIKIIKELTKGQACTCEIGLKNEDVNKPLFIGACDNSMILDYDKLDKLIEQSDVLAFSFRNNFVTERNPNAYGWLKTDNQNNIIDVSVKIPISNHPVKDHAIVGAFYFKSVQIFLDCLEYLYKNNIRVNNEYYVDSCIKAAIELGFITKVFETDKYISWGIPDDYNTFVYYQSLFHKLNEHPYSLEKDFTVNKNKIIELDKKYRTFNQK